MDPATVAAIANAGKQILGFATQKKAEKKAANMQADYTKHTGRFWDVFNSNVGQFSELGLLNEADKQVLAQAATSMASAIDANPYAYEGDTTFTSRGYQPIFNGQSIDIYNAKIKTLFEDYLDQKKGQGMTNALSLGTGQPPDIFSTVSDFLKRTNEFLAGAAKDIGGVKQTISGAGPATPAQVPAQPKNWTPIIIGGIAILAVVMLIRRK